MSPFFSSATQLVGGRRYPVGPTMPSDPAPLVMARHGHKFIPADVDYTGRHRHNN